MRRRRPSVSASRLAAVGLRAGAALRARDSPTALHLSLAAPAVRAAASRRGQASGASTATWGPVRPLPTVRHPEAAEPGPVLPPRRCQGVRPPPEAARSGKRGSSPVFSVQPETVLVPAPTSVFLLPFLRLALD